MHIYSIIKTSCLLLTVAVVVSCSIPKNQTAVSNLQTPAAYVNSKDTVNSADIAYHVFYASPYLKNLIDTVLQHNYDLQMASQRIAWSRAQIKQSQGALLPTVNASVMPSLRKFGLYTMDGAGNIVTDIEKGKLVPIDLPDFYVGFQASWEVDIWKKLSNRKQSAIARFYAGREARNLIITNLIAETATAYYELLATDQVIRLLDETITLQQQAYEMVKVQKEAAQVNELGVQQFNAQLIGLKSMKAEMQQQIIELEGRISMLSGKFYQPIRRDTGMLNSLALPVMKTGIPSQLLLNRPDIRQAEWELAASKADAKSARAAFLPTLNITGALGVQAYKPDLLFQSPESVAYSMIAGITAPLINRNFIKGEYAKASAAQKEALLNYEKNITRSFTEVYQEQKKIENLSELFQLKQEEARVFNSSINIASDLFRTGRATYLEVLLTRQNALKASMELIQVKKMQFLSAVHLYKALGGGWK